MELFGGRGADSTTESGTPGVCPADVLVLHIGPWKKEEKHVGEMISLVEGTGQLQLAQRIMVQPFSLSPFCGT